MVQEICEIKSWQDVYDAGLSPDEIEIWNKVETIQEEVKILFEDVIYNQIFNADDIYSYYLVPPDFWEKMFSEVESDTFPDLSCVRDTYFYELDKIYAELNKYINLPFYKSQADNISLYKYFKVFYGMFFGQGAKSFIDYTKKKGIIGAYNDLNYVKVKNIITFYVRSFSKALNNLINKYENLVWKLLHIKVPVTSPGGFIRFGENKKEELDKIRKYIEELKSVKSVYDEWVQSFLISDPKNISELFYKYFNG
jgi:hypothetical protein